MARKKTGKDSGSMQTVHSHGAVALKAEALENKREGRKTGDGQGVDPSISPGAFGTTLQKTLTKLSPDTQKRMLTHIRNSVDEAMRPIVKLLGRDATDYDVALFKDVGPNMLRTVMEFLEERDNTQV